MNHLKLCTYSIAVLRINKTFEILEDLRITYQMAMGVQFGDFIIFWNCENLPDTLPKYLTEYEGNPNEWEGSYLDEKDVKKINQFKGGKIFFDKISIRINKLKINDCEKLEKQISLFKIRKSIPEPHKMVMNVDFKKDLFIVTFKP